MMKRHMKDSGIDWIGEIPDDWNIEKVKFTIKWKSEKGNPDGEVLSLYRDYGIVPKNSKNDNHNVTSLDTSTYKVVNRGDFVINKMKAWQGSMALSEYDGIVSPAYHVCEFTNDSVDKKYFHYLMRNVSYLPEYRRLSTGLRIGQWDLSFDDFKNLPFLIPPIAEQKSIVEVIDKKTAEIDTVIERTKSSIEEYKKLKQSVITKAVTKGIRPNRQMKDSGNMWIPQMPSVWELSRVGLHFTIILGKMLCSECLSEDYTEEYYYCAADVHFDGVSNNNNKKMWFSSSEKEQYRVLLNDLLIVEGGAGAGGSAIVSALDKKMYIQNSIMIVRPKSNSDNRYLCYLMQYLVKSGYVDIVCNKATIPHFTKDKVANIPFPVSNEQQEIADYLDKKIPEINSLIAKKEELIAELEAYKKSLIYEYVTGKKEVI